MADIQVSVVPENDLTVFTVTGEVTADEIIRTSHDQYLKQQTSLTLWDFTDASSDAIDTGELERIAGEVKDFSENGAKGKIALVRSNDENIGLVKMFTAFAQIVGVPFEYRVFKNNESARAWLGLE